LDKESRLQRNEIDFITAELDGELVLMHTNSGEYFGMDKTTTKMWNLLEQPMTIESLVLELTQIFEVEKDRCETDIKPVLSTMMNRGFLNTI